MTEAMHSTKRLNGILLRGPIHRAKGDEMLTVGIKLLRADFERTRSSRFGRRGRFQQLGEYAKLDWEPWTQGGPTDSLAPSDESMFAAAEASRTAYSITMANLANTARMLNAMVQMIEGAQGRMIVSACACLQKRKPQNFAYRHRQRRRKPLR